MLLLAIDPSDLFPYLIGTIVLLVITCFFIRWAVRADSIVRNQQAMIWFMILQCKKQGVPDEEIQKLKDHFGIK